MIRTYDDERAVSPDLRVEEVEETRKVLVEAAQRVVGLVALGSVQVADAVGGREPDRQQVRRVVAPEPLAAPRG